jgi:hypothetical protein
VIACVQDRAPAVFALHGSPLRLYIEHEVDTVSEPVQTASYRYVVQATDAHNSWLLRWEYQRERPPGYPYPLGHLHVNSRFAEDTGAALASKPLPRLHLPTGRIPFELVLRHLIAEWGVRAKADDWSSILDESLATGFQERPGAP